MHVLIWSDNRVLSGLVARNLGRRGFDVRERRLPANLARDGRESDDADVVVVDLDCPEPDVWHRASRIRTLLPGIPLVILGHPWPTSPRIERLQPCAYVRKPFAIDALMAAVHDATSRPCPAH